MSQITLSNVGPIERLDIPIPPEGGVVVLRGGQGVGKSTAIRAVNKMLGGTSKGLATRDGQQRGSVELGTARLSITTSRTTKRGTLEVAEIESKMDLSKLVDPLIDDADRADAARIKALVNLAGVKADPANYYELVGGKEAFESLTVDTKTDSPVELAARVKRSLESRARQFEKTYQQEVGKAAGANSVGEGIDLTAEHDEATLRARYDQALLERTTLMERKRAYDEQAKTREAARQALATAESSYSGVDPSEAAAQVKRTSQALSEALAAKDEAERIYFEAKEKLATRQGEHNAATQALHNAEQHYRDIEGWRSSLGTSVEAGPTEDELAAAESAVQQASAAMEQGFAVREAKEQAAIAEQMIASANETKRIAEAFRDAAAGTDEILSRLIPAGPLRVEGGRLVLTTERGSEPFGDLSDGERWKIAIDLAADQLPEKGLLTAPQIAWEGLTESTRADIAQHAKRRGVVVLTAEAVDGELTAEVAA